MTLATGTPSPWFVYLVRTGAGALYAGISTDPERRLRQHQSGKGARALRGKGPLTLAWHGEGAFVNGGLADKLLLMGSAPATLLPVGLFCYAVARTPMSTVGLLQYIEPSLAFLLAIFWFGEIPDPVKSVGFAFVWAGLLVSLLPLHRLRRGRVLWKES